MASFPDLLTGVAPQVPTLDMDIRFLTLTSDFENSGASAKRKLLFPKRSFNLKYNNISKANGRTLWQFYIARYGKYEAFSFFMPFSDEYLWEYVGAGDGSTTVFNLPSKNASSFSLRSGTVDMIQTTDYTFSAGAGADGADRLTMIIPPDDGTILTWSFSGLLKVRCRFADDVASFSTFMNRLVSAGLVLKGQNNDA